MQTGKGHRLVFEPPTSTELRIILESFQRFMNPSDIRLLLKDKRILIVRGRRLEVYLVSNTLWNLYTSVKEWRHPYFIGLFLGEIRGKILQPSLHVCHRLSSKPVSEAVVVVTPQGEQRFLYGKNLENNHLEKQPKEEIANLEVIVLNRQGEGLGFGKLKQESGEKITLQNRKDLGWYLRMGG